MDLEIFLFFGIFFEIFFLEMSSEKSKKRSIEVPDETDDALAALADHEVNKKKDRKVIC